MQVGIKVVNEPPQPVYSWVESIVTLSGVLHLTGGWGLRSPSVFRPSDTAHIVCPLLKIFPLVISDEGEETVGRT